MGAPDNEALKIGLEHARAWFTLHAGQRMQLVNFFIAAVAFLTAAYVAAFDANAYPLATAVAVVGIFVCFAFNRLEVRTRELVRAGEEAISRLETVLAERTDTAELRLIELVEQPARPFTAYSDVIPILQWIAGVAFTVGGIYAIVRDIL